MSKGAVLAGKQHFILYVGRDYIYSILYAKHISSQRSATIQHYENT